MEKETVGECSYGPVVSWEVFGEFYTTIQDGTARMVGKTMEVIEALGLPQKQEEAAKKIIKEKLWDQEQWMDANLRRLVPEDQIPTIGGTMVNPPPPVI